ncbi:hypothetical protein EBR03_00820 [bacterium]|nr:hypothetical protein [bacterium]
MFLALGIVLATAGISAWYLYHWSVFFNSDFAMIGLIGERILKTGETHLYVPMVGYQGLLIEGYLSAFLFQLFGTSPQTLHLTAVLAYVVFVFWFYLSVKVWFDRKTAQLSVLFICLSSPLFFAHVLRTQPNYPETFAVGCFLFWAFKRFMESGRKKFFYWGCLAAGFGFYLYGQIIYFFLCVFISFLIHRLSWEPLRKIIRNQKLNYLLGAGLIVSVLPTMTFSGLRIPGPTLGVVCFLVWFCKQVMNFREPIRRFILKNTKPFIVGALLFVVGYFPSLYHRVVLGRFAKSGIKLIKFSEEFWLNLKLLLVHAGDFLIGSEYFAISVVLAVVSVGVIAWFVLSECKHKPRAVSPFVLLGPVILVGFLSSRSVCEGFSLRYILGLHLVLSVSLALLMNKLLSKSRALAVIFLLIWMGNGLYSNVRAPWVWSKARSYSQLTRWEDVQGLVEYLDKIKLPVGYSDYWVAYLTNFVTRGRLVLEPLYTNYLPFFEETVKKEARIVMIKDKDRLSAGPDMTSNPREVSINNITYRVIDETEVQFWKVWILEKT